MGSPRKHSSFLVWLAIAACQPEKSGTDDNDRTSESTSSSPNSQTTTTTAATGATSATPSSGGSSSATDPSTTSATAAPSTTTNEPTGSSTSTQLPTSESTDQSSSPHTSEPTSSEPAATSADTSASSGSDGCANALLCDDFDDDTVGMAPGQPWTTDVNGGGIEVSSERAFSGNQSVHVSNTQGAYKRAYFSVEGAPLFPAAGQEMYGRMMMWLEATPVGSVHWTFIQGEGPSEDGSYDIFYRYGGQHDGKLMANFETQGKATDCWKHSATVMPTQTWACLEWRFNVATDEMQFWLNGAEVEDIHATGMGEGCVSDDLSGAWPAPAAFEVLRLGWEKYQESTQLNAWIDDVAVGASRVGCPDMP